MTLARLHRAGLILGGLAAILGATSTAAATRHARHATPPPAQTVEPAPAPAPLAEFAPAGATPAQKIIVHRNAGSDTSVLVTLGIPFAPGALTDAKNVRILDEKGVEVPAAVATSLTWFFKDDSVRAVRVQFRAELDRDDKTFFFATDKPRSADIEFRPYAESTLVGELQLPVPAALATLTPEWMCASLIAGPQLPAAKDEAYAAYVARQFEWAKPLPAKDASAWLFDRPTALYKAYLRSGRLDYLQAAVLSYRFYMKHLRRDGLPLPKFCGGGWDFGGKPCDVKYVYAEPILLALALSGDDSEHDPALVDKMMTEWNRNGWSTPPGEYDAPTRPFTERLAGLGLLETVSAYELTGNDLYKARIDARIGWLYRHQQANPDGLGDDGSWRSSWNLHEDDKDKDAPDDVRGASSWMSENIIDALWHAWLVTGDERIPRMINGYGRYLERYGWIDLKKLKPDDFAAKKVDDWRNSCSGPDGQIAWYWSSAHADVGALVKIQGSEGWYTDAHDVELAFAVAAARYFETDPAMIAAFDRRLAALASSYSIACAAIGDTVRRFNWNNRGSGAAQWLMRQPAGAGVATLRAQ